MRRVLVLSPHPDDEALGCGGTLRSHATVGDEVRVIFLTSGERGGHGRSEAATRTLREAEAAAAAQILGISDLEFWRQPDGGLVASRELVDQLCELVAGWHPEVIYAPHPAEAHADHRAAARLLRKALAAGMEAAPAALRMFEVWTPLQKLDEIVDISPFLETKLSAIRAYRSQCEVMDFDAAFLGLSRYRGELHSWPGGDYAEVFENPRK